MHKKLSDLDLRDGVVERYPSRNEKLLRLGFSNVELVRGATSGLAVLESSFRQFGEIAEKLRARPYLNACQI